MSKSKMDRRYLRFKKGLENLLNIHSMELGSNTPNFIMAEFLIKCLKAFNTAVRQRETWYGVIRPKAHIPGIPDDTLEQVSPEFLEAVDTSLERNRPALEELGRLDAEEGVQ